MILLVVGLVGLLGSLLGVADQMLPRRFTAGQQRQIADWEYGQRWRTLPAGTTFPASVGYAPQTALDDDVSLTLTARRVGIARQASCASAVDPTAAKVLSAAGCAAVLRATYVDGTDSYVITVGVAVLPTGARATTAARAIDGAGGASGLGPTVRTVPFSRTPASGFSNTRRQLSGVVAAGTYVVLYTVGYADDRPKVPVSGDNYADGEMTGVGQGVAHAVLSSLAAAVSPPHCPGTSGC
jgi:hypothetical protein